MKKYFLFSNFAKIKGYFETVYLQKNGKFAKTDKNIKYFDSFSQAMEYKESNNLSNIVECDSIIESYSIEIHSKNNIDVPFSNVDKKTAILEYETLDYRLKNIMSGDIIRIVCNNSNKVIKEKIAK